MTGKVTCDLCVCAQTCVLVAFALQGHNTNTTLGPWKRARRDY